MANQNPNSPIAIDALLKELDIQLTGVPKRAEVRTPGVSDPVHIESLVAFDQYAKMRQYPPALVRLTPAIRAALNYGHKVYLTPDKTKLDGMLGQLNDAFAEGWQEAVLHEVASAEPGLPPVVGLHAEALVARVNLLAQMQRNLVLYLRGE